MLSQCIPNDLSEIFVDFKFSWNLGLYLALSTRRSQHSSTLIAGLEQPGIRSISLQVDFLQTSRPILTSSSLSWLVRFHFVLASKIIFPCFSQETVQLIEWNTYLSAQLWL
jgi:hypothetical protein